jgi:benzylsuccinate CoA-transferase BbsF subunit
MTPQPLAGYRVIDFCWMIAGPLTTRLLADLGAEVIRVESQARIDRIREVGVQPPGLTSIDTNGVFNDCNVNKKSVLLNLGHPRGVAIAKDLVRTADIVTSNFTPDRMDRWGLGYQDLKAVKHDIIVASMPVMGSEGSRNSWRAVGNGVVAMAGLNAHTGFPHRPPIGLGTLHSDFTSPYFAALQVAAAVLHRQKTGEGQFIELAQYEASVHLLDTELLEVLVNGQEPPRRGNRSAHHAPHGVFPCHGPDRWVAIAVRSEQEWQSLCKVLDLQDLASRPDLNAFAGRQAAAGEIETAIRARTVTWDAWDLSAALQSAGVPASPVEDVGDLVGRDPMHEGFLAEVQHPAGPAMLLQHEPVVWNGERFPIRPAPIMGEHTGDVFRQLLGFSAEDLAELVAEGVIY